jgi:hypothetical protein
MNIDRTADRVVMAALVAIGYLAFVTHGDFDLFGISDFKGLTFNSMLLHMLDGRFDVDPAAIRVEAFVRGGRSYAYFGIFPALLRLPLLPFLDLRTTHVERLSCWFAMMTGAAGYVTALRLAFHRVTSLPIRAAMLPPLMAVALLSGPAIMLGADSAIYHEPMLWGWALAMVFVALAFHAMFRSGRFSAATLVGMAAVAGMALLTRVTIGLGLYAALGLMMLGLCLRSDAETGAGVRGVGRRLRQPRFWMSGLVLGGFVIMTGAVNMARWGNPMVFADLHDQTWLIAEYPDRLARLARYGLFDVRRLGFGIGYYFLPIWGDWADAVFPLRDRITDLFDALEMPSSSFFISDPLSVMLAGMAVLGLLRGRIAGERGRLGGLLLLGLAIPPILMMTAWYMAFRYRVEFYPFLAAASCLAAASWAERLQTEDGRSLVGIGRAMTCLALLQIGGSELESLAFRVSAPGPSGYRALSLVDTGEQVIDSLMAGPLTANPTRIAHHPISP